MRENVIEIRGLNKSFGEIHAVRDVSFSVKKGSLFAFLGANGAGKSTTIAMLCGQLAKDSGEILVGGRSLSEDPDGILREIGVVLQQSVLDMPLTVRDNLESRGALYGIYGEELDTRVRELSELLALAPLMNRPLGKLSGGQRRRIDIARALLHRPSILILDEPTTGLDPQTRRTVWEVISHLQKTENLTVFLTTHYMEEAASSDYAVILDEGRIVAEGTPLELKNRYGGDYISLYGISEAQARSLGYPCEKLPDGWKISVPDTATATRLILEHAELFADWEVIKGRMDDVFLAVTGKSLGEEEKTEGGRKKK